MALYMQIKCKSHSRIALQYPRQKVFANKVVDLPNGERKACDGLRYNLVFENRACFFRAHHNNAITVHIQGFQNGKIQERNFENKT